MFRKIGRGLKRFFNNRITQAVVMQAAAVAVPHVSLFLKAGWQKTAVQNILNDLDFAAMDEYGDLADVANAKAIARESIVALLVHQGFSESVARIAVEVALQEAKGGLKQ